MLAQSCAELARHPGQQWERQLRGRHLRTHRHKQLHRIAASLPLLLVAESRLPAIRLPSILSRRRCLCHRSCHLGGGCLGQRRDMLVVEQQHAQQLPAASWQLSTASAAAGERGEGGLGQQRQQAGHCCIPHLALVGVPRSGRQQQAHRRHCHRLPSLLLTFPRRCRCVPSQRGLNCGSGVLDTGAEAARKLAMKQPEQRRQLGKQLGALLPALRALLQPLHRRGGCRQQRGGQRLAGCRAAAAQHRRQHRPAARPQLSRRVGPIRLLRLLLLALLGWFAAAVPGCRWCTRLFGQGRAAPVQQRAKVVGTHQRWQRRHIRFCRRRGFCLRAIQQRRYQLFCCLHLAASTGTEVAR